MADTLYCSFCGKSQHDVLKLVAGPTSLICNECVDLCHDICHERDKVVPLYPNILGELAERVAAIETKIAAETAP